MRKALIAAGVFEMLGALALGAHVAGTMKSGIAKYSCFEADPALYMIGMMAALAAAAIWILFASLAGLPVSATHSIVGGIVGMAVALKGFSCVTWGMTGVAKIAISWVSSPVLACAAAFIVYTLIVRVIYHSNVSFERALWSTPPLMAGAILFIEMLVFWDRLSLWWAKLILFAGTFILIALLTAFVGIPYLRRQINNAYLRTSTAESVNNQTQNSIISSIYRSISNFVEGGDDSKQVELDDVENGASSSTQNGGASSSSASGRHNTRSTRRKAPNFRGNINEDSESSQRIDEFEENGGDDDDDSEPHQLDDDDETPIEGQEGLVSMADLERDGEVSEDESKATQVYWYLQNVTACIGAFAHGANDTANMIGPFAAIWHLWRDGTFDAAGAVPLWIVAIGGVSIVLGLGLLGYRVIRTMGQEIVHIDYPSGFASELASAMTVVVASRLQIPVSSTHCQVGAIIGVGLVNNTPSNSTEILVTPLQPHGQLSATSSETNLKDHYNSNQDDDNDSDSNDGLSSTDPRAPNTTSSVPSTTSPNSLPPDTRFARFWKSLKGRAAQVQWKSVGKIFISWLVTLPVSAGISALIAIILKQFVKT